MANSYFKFKQFTINQDQCAMKVGTDGVLLGAWIDIANATNVLDVGTGTGIIALMLAQRSGDKLNIDAIDIDNIALAQAKENIEQSPFNNIACQHTPLAQYTDSTPYDLIVSNPPFFNNSLPSPNEKRTLARHTETLPIATLISEAAQRLSPRGRISVIYPYSEKSNLLALAAINGLSVSRITHVFPLPSSKPKRILIELSKEKITSCLECDLVIELERHLYSPTFTKLMADFYLAK